MDMMAPMKITIFMIHIGRGGSNQSPSEIDIIRSIPIYVQRICTSNSRQPFKSTYFGILLSALLKGPCTAEAAWKQLLERNVINPQAPRLE
jgi:hypothetical protein